MAKRRVNVAEYFNQLPPEVQEQWRAEKAFQERKANIGALPAHLENLAVGTAQGLGNAVVSLLETPEALSNAVFGTNFDTRPMFGPGSARGMTRFDVGPAAAIGHTAGFIGSFALPAAGAARLGSGLLGSGARLLAADMAAGRAAARGINALGKAAGRTKPLIPVAARTGASRAARAAADEAVAGANILQRGAAQALEFGALSFARTPGDLDTRMAAGLHGLPAGAILGAAGRGLGVVETATGKLLTGRAATRFLAKHGGTRKAFESGVARAESIPRFAGTQMARMGGAGLLLPGFSPISMTGNERIDSGIFNALFGLGHAARAHVPLVEGRKSAQLRELAIKAPGAAGRYTPPPGFIETLRVAKGGPEGPYTEYQFAERARRIARIEADAARRRGEAGVEGQMPLFPDRPTGSIADTTRNIGRRVSDLQAERESLRTARHVEATDQTRSSLAERRIIEIDAEIARLTEQLDAVQKGKQDPAPRQGNLNFEPARDRTPKRRYEDTMEPPPADGPQRNPFTGRFAKGQGEMFPMEEIIGENVNRPRMREADIRAEDVAPRRDITEDPNARPGLYDETPFGPAIAFGLGDRVQELRSEVRGTVEGFVKDQQGNDRFAVRRDDGSQAYYLRDELQNERPGRETALERTALASATEAEMMARARYTENPTDVNRDALLASEQAREAAQAQLERRQRALDSDTEWVTKVGTVGLRNYDLLMKQARQRMDQARLDGDVLEAMRWKEVLDRFAAHRPDPRTMLHSRNLFKDQTGRLDAEAFNNRIEAVTDPVTGELRTEVIDAADMKIEMIEALLQSAPTRVAPDILYHAKERDGITLRSNDVMDLVKATSERQLTPQGTVESTYAREAQEVIREIVEADLNAMDKSLFEPGRDLNVEIVPQAGPLHFAAIDKSTNTLYLDPHYFGLPGFTRRRVNIEELTHIRTSFSKFGIPNTAGGTHATVRALHILYENAGVVMRPRDPGYQAQILDLHMRMDDLLFSAGVQSFIDLPSAELTRYNEMMQRVNDLQQRVGRSDYEFFHMIQDAMDKFLPGIKREHPDIMDLPEQYTRRLPRARELTQLLKDEGRNLPDQQPLWDGDTRWRDDRFAQTPSRSALVELPYEFGSVRLLPDDAPHTPLTELRPKITILRMREGRDPVGARHVYYPVLDYPDGRRAVFRYSTYRDTDIPGMLHGPDVFPSWSLSRLHPKDLTYVRNVMTFQRMGALHVGKKETQAISKMIAQDYQGMQRTHFSRISAPDHFTEAQLRERGRMRINTLRQRERPGKELKPQLLAISDVHPDGTTMGDQVRTPSEGIRSVFDVPSRWSSAADPAVYTGPRARRWAVYDDNHQLVREVTHVSAPATPPEFVFGKERLIQWKKRIEQEGGQLVIATYMDANGQFQHVPMAINHTSRVGARDQHIPDSYFVTPYWEWMELNAHRVTANPVRGSYYAYKNHLEYVANLAAHKEMHGRESLDRTHPGANEMLDLILGKQDVHVQGQRVLDHEVESGGSAPVKPYLTEAQFRQRWLDANERLVSGRFRPEPAEYTARHLAREEGGDATAQGVMMRLAEQGSDPVAELSRLAREREIARRAPLEHPEHAWRDPESQLTLAELRDQWAKYEQAPQRDPVQGELFPESEYYGPPGEVRVRFGNTFPYDNAELLHSRNRNYDRAQHDASRTPQERFLMVDPQTVKQGGREHTEAPMLMEPEAREQWAFNVIARPATYKGEAVQGAGPRLSWLKNDEGNRARADEIFDTAIEVMRDKDLTGYTDVEVNREFVRTMRDLARDRYPERGASEIPIMEWDGTTTPIEDFSKDSPFTSSLDAERLMDLGAAQTRVREGVQGKGRIRRSDQELLFQHSKVAQSALTTKLAVVFNNGATSLERGIPNRTMREIIRLKYGSALNEVGEYLYTENGQPMSREGQLTNAEIAARVGVSRETVSENIRRFIWDTSVEGARDRTFLNGHPPVRTLPFTKRGSIRGGNRPVDPEPTVDVIHTKNLYRPRGVKEIVQTPGQPPRVVENKRKRRRLPTELTTRVNGNPAIVQHYHQMRKLAGGDITDKGVIPGDTVYLDPVTGEILTRQSSMFDAKNAITRRAKAERDQGIETAENQVVEPPAVDPVETHAVEVIAGEKLLNQRTPPVDPAVGEALRQSRLPFGNPDRALGARLRNLQREFFALNDSIDRANPDPQAALQAKTNNPRYVELNNEIAEIYAQNRKSKRKGNDDDSKPDPGQVEIPFVWEIPPKQARFQGKGFGQSRKDKDTRWAGNRAQEKYSQLLAKAKAKVGEKGMKEEEFAVLNVHDKVEHVLRRLSRAKNPNHYTNILGLYGRLLGSRDYATFASLAPLDKPSRWSKVTQDATDLHVELRVQPDGSIRITELDSGRTVDVNDTGTVAMLLDLRRTRLKDAPHLGPAEFEHIRMNNGDGSGGPRTMRGPQDPAWDGEAGPPPPVPPDGQGPRWPSGTGPNADLFRNRFVSMRKVRAQSDYFATLAKKIGDWDIFRAADGLIKAGNEADRLAQEAVNRMEKLARKHNIGGAGPRVSEGGSFLSRMAVHVKDPLRSKRTEAMERLGRAAADLDEIAMDQLGVSKDMRHVSEYVTRIEDTIYAQHGLAPNEVAFLKEARREWNRAWVQFGLEPAGYVPGYFTRFRPRDASRNTSSVLRAVGMPRPMVEFFAMNERMGEFQGRSTHYMNVWGAYTRAGWRYKLLNEKPGAAGPSVLEFADAVLANYTEKAGSKRVVPENMEPLMLLMDRAKGIPDPGMVVARKAARGRMQQRQELVKDALDWIDKNNLPVSGFVTDLLKREHARLGVKISDVNVATWADMVTGLNRGRTFGLHAMRAIRHVTQSWFFTLPRVGPKYFGKALNEMLNKDTFETALLKAKAAGVIKPAFWHDYINSRSKLLSTVDKLSFIYRYGDMWERTLSFRAQQMRSHDAMVRFKQRERTMSFEENFERYSVESNLNLLHPAFRIPVRDMLKRPQPNYAGAIREHARRLSDHTVFDYTRMNQPQWSGTVWGRVFGQYGRWPLGAIETMNAMVRYGTPRQKMEIAATYAGVSAVVYGMGQAFGVETAEWIPWVHAFGYTGGPFMTFGEDVKSVASGDPIATDTFLNNMKHDPVATAFSTPFRYLLPAADVSEALAAEMNWSRRQRRILGIPGPAWDRHQFYTRLLGFRPTSDPVHTKSLTKKGLTKPFSPFGEAIRGAVAESIAGAQAPPKRP